MIEEFGKKNPVDMLSVSWEVLALKSFVTDEHVKKNYRIKIAEQVKLWSAILCKRMQDQKKAQKDELKNAQDRSSWWIFAISPCYSPFDFWWFAGCTIIEATYISNFVIQPLLYEWLLN